MKSIKILLSFFLFAQISACVSVSNVPQIDLPANARIGYQFNLDSKVVHTHVGTTVFNNFSRDQRYRWNLNNFAAFEAERLITAWGYVPVAVEGSPLIGSSERQIHQHNQRRLAQLKEQYNLDALITITSTANVVYSECDAHKCIEFDARHPGLFSRDSVLSRPSLFAALPSVNSVSIIEPYTPLQSSVDGGHSQAKKLRDFSPENFRKMSAQEWREVEEGVRLLITETLVNNLTQLSGVVELEPADIYARTAESRPVSSTPLESPTVTYDEQPPAVPKAVLQNTVSPKQPWTSAELVILGVAQDAGFPQIGCYEQRCLRAWENANLRQSATSVAMIDYANKQTLLFDASPDLPDQLYQLHRIAPVHEYALAGIFLTHAHIGHYTGLMYFGHEAQGAKGVPVYAMPRMRDFLSTNGPWDQLVKFGNIALRPLQAEQLIDINGIKVKPFLVPHRDEYSETVGYVIQGPQKRAVYLPDINSWQNWNESLVELVKNHDYLLLDATFYNARELPGRDIASVPHPLVEDTMQRLKDLPQNEKNKVWFIHFNQSNPLLDPRSEQSRRVIENGFNISRVGARLPL